MVSFRAQLSDVKVLKVKADDNLFDFKLSLETYDIGPMATTSPSVQGPKLTNLRPPGFQIVVARAPLQCGPRWKRGSRREEGYFQ